MLRTVTTISLAFAILNGLARADNNAEDKGNKELLDNKKVAIVYYSHSGETYSSTGEYPKLREGNTEVVAEDIKKKYQR